MKKIILLTVCILAFSHAKAQISALTQTGDEVVLFDDGTWKYLNDSTLTEKVIPVNEQTFAKESKASFLVKSKKVKTGVWMNPKKWTFAKGADNEAQEFFFTKKSDDLYAMFITEKLQIPIENLREIAIQNARSAAPDIRVVKEEYRNVNGVKVLMMQMSGTIQGMKFRYFGYYFSNESGTIQLIAYTGENLFNEYEAETEQFLNGFVEL